MVRTLEHNGVRWIDLLQPQPEELKELEGKFAFHHLLVEELRAPTYHPLAEFYGKYLFIILHFPQFAEATHRIHGIEIDFLITHEVLVTIRYEEFGDFESFWEEARQNPGRYLTKTPGHTFYFLVKRLFNRIFPELDEMGTTIHQVEKQIFQDFDESIIERIALVKRQILRFVRAMKPQRVVWNSLPGYALSFWGERMKPYFSDLVAEYERTMTLIETHHEVINSLHLTSSSLLDHRQNYVIKILTIFTAIILPLSLVASIYGMNLNYLPFATHDNAFWWFMGGMLIVTVLMLLYFHKRRKWL
ncbi:MAG: hypothetical protein A3F24_02390 [Candidatus Colwellbacteria bacterium RIFCSPHIGHO2_12_FULL_44_17]|uniref:Magnesium transport protein CorA n=2 Tax=Candidatus Colwelliibacteriota TaxID=1817904 RepID=A0A1G1Z741_9BACT|nr:MAG: hypothetical protein A3F24_02390 [Candidatus Colwellbacteria bacterium RIFCSPHIGHO2_12_FULL_44_17]OGY60334.1 MAG: hypothetical protein A3I31_02605 [Candidatus Colwellbacteria bacterium RIFCSPLOWO2_02_FULL_44_20b]